LSNTVDTSASSAGPPAPQARRPRMKWRYVYFLLAAFVVLTISLSLLLNHQLVKTNKRTVQKNLQWVSWLKQCDALSKQAGEINVQGSDVLTSHDVPLESREMDAALSVFNQILSMLRSELLRNVYPTNVMVLLNDCSSIRERTDVLTGRIDSVFSLARDGRLDQAQSKITLMNRDYDGVLRALDGLRSHLRAQREAYLQGQIAGANALQRYEWLLGLLVVVMVIGVTVYGVRLDRHVSESEAQIREAQERYRSLVEQSTDGILIADDNWNLRFANQAACQMFGYTDEEMVHLNVEDTYVPEDRNLAARRKQEIRTGESARYERLVLRKDGSRFHAEVIVRRLDQGGSQAIFRDITERRQAEAALRESEGRVRTILDSVHTGIVVIDPVDQRIVDANPEAVNLIGAPREQIVGTTCHRFICPAEQGKCPIIDLKRTVDCCERILLTASGEGRPVIKSVARITLGGRPHLLESFIDITERKKAEQSLRDANTRLEDVLEELRSTQQRVIEQERLHALGGMASGIAHDFNNALVGILGLSELLLDRPENLEDKEKARRYLEMINTSARDAGDIVNRLREFYRHREKQEAFGVVDLNALIEEAISVTQPMWKTQAEAKDSAISIRKDLQAVPPVAGNAGELREVLTNLIFNAVDAIPHGGTIGIGTRRDGDQVILEVSDTGSGMTEEVRRRCLEPFFTTKGAHGTGLGLSMVYGTVQRHQGTIDIRTEIGKGSIFIIHLPSQVARSRPEGQRLQTSPLQNLHVLLVDDEAIVRKVIGEYLKIDGHTVEAATGGQDGMEKFHAGRFDLVVVDRAMPDMNGDQVATAIKSANPAVPVVMLTGFGAMMEATGEKPDGVDLVVSKPVTIDGLRRAVAKALGNN
jgi:PAS domain S-box-containing protein